MTTVTATSACYWSDGDFCIYKCSGTNAYTLGFLKALDVNNRHCTVVSCASGVERQLSSDDLLALTPDTIKLVTDPNLHKLSLDQRLDSIYFTQKLGKMTSAMAGKLSKKLAKSIPPEPAKTAPSTRWTVGQMCICMWSEDEGYYFGTIQEARPEEDQYLVSFCYYNNTELKRAADLHELGSDFELLVEDEYNKTAAGRLRKRPTSHRKAEQVVTDDVEQTTNEYAALMTLAPDGSAATNAAIPVSKTDYPQPATVSQKPTTRLIPGLASSFGDQQPAFTAPPTGSFPPSFANLATLKPCNEVQDTSQAPWQALLISWFMCGYHTGYFEALQSAAKR
ncbi:hypothetical protein CSKR_202010 [Clonorchis sinensis]|uniref:Tudor domain-containing protein n=1 Tax=Clonorchis sinensis TaxID=79923 RepID=A0A8T1MZD2_CLOSI|nr:hypothetical protein CSKR_202010 [Clonorchis sinensis]